MPYWLTCDLSALLPLQLCVNCVSFGAWWVNDLALFSNVASGSRACKATGSLGSQWPTGGRIRELTTTTAKRAAAGEPLCFSVVLPHLGIHEFFYLATKSPAQCLRVEWTPKCVDLRRSQRTWSLCRARYHHPSNCCTAEQQLWQMSEENQKLAPNGDEQLCHWLSLYMHFFFFWQRIVTWQ